MIIKIALGILAGAVLGGLLGYYGKCTSGTCPLTANPYRGALYGGLLGLLLSWSLFGSMGNRGADNTSTTENHHMTRQINETEFQNEVLNGGKVALVDFYADWCGPCRALAPTIASLAASYGDRALIAKIDVDKHPDLAGQYRIQGIPAVLVFKNGQVVNRLIGLQDRRQYEQALEEALKDTAQLPTGS